MKITPQQGEFLSTRRTGHLATSDGQQVHVRPMGAWILDQSESIYFVGHKDSKKVADIGCIADAKVAFCNADTMQSLRLGGVLKQDENPAILSQLIDRYPEWYAQVKERISDIALLKLSIKRVEKMNLE